jgi:hypothetical protein
MGAFLLGVQSLHLNLLTRSGPASVGNPTSRATIVVSYYSREYRRVPFLRFCHMSRLRSTRRKSADDTTIVELLARPRGPPPFATLPISALLQTN